MPEIFGPVTGVSMFVGAVVALIHAFRLVLPDIVSALKTRAESKRLDEERKTKDSEARAAAEADIRARLDHCEVSHKERDERDAARDERDRRRDIEHARDLGFFRGQVARLREEVSVLRGGNAGPTSPKGQV